MVVIKNEIKKPLKNKSNKQIKYYKILKKKIKKNKMTTTSRDEELKQFETDFNKSLGKYIPKTGRITELEDFSNDFNNRLSKAYEKFSKTVKKIK